LHFELAKRNTCTISVTTVRHLFLAIFLKVNVEANLRISTDKPDAFPWIDLLTTETAKFRPANRRQYLIMIDR
jgi:hypothetical protein